MGSVEVLWDGDEDTPRKDMGSVELLWDGDGVLHPPVNRQTPVKTVPYRRTTYAGLNKATNHEYNKDLTDGELFANDEIIFQVHKQFLTEQKAKSLFP